MMNYHQSNYDKQKREQLEKKSYSLLSASRSFSFFEIYSHSYLLSFRIWITDTMDSSIVIYQR